MNNKIFNYFADLIYTNSGIVYSDHNINSLISRLNHISSELGYSDVNEMYRDFFNNTVKKEHKQKLLDLATNNETYFFRDPIVWSNFKNIIIDKIKSGQSTFSFWSAASSSGQEAISIAITMEEIKKDYNNIQYTIEASDISESILNKAKNGEYSNLEIGRGLSKERLDSFFTKQSNEKYKVNPVIRNKIYFCSKNLFNLPKHDSTFDFIFIRNVLIYQNTENKIKIIENIRKCLQKNGYIILGAGESMLGLTKELTSTVYNGSVFYQPTNNKKVA